MGDLKSSARAGIRWSGIVAAVSGAVQVLRVFVLARFLLEPDDFGLMALAAAISYIASPLADVGTLLALIHRQDASREEISSLYWFNVILGLLLSLLLCMLAPYLAHALGEPRLTPVLRLASLCFAIDGFGLMFLILLKRDLDFRRTSLIETCALLAGTAVTLVLALRHGGVWSLVAGVVAVSIVRTALAIKYGIGQYRIAARLRAGELKRFLSFGVFQMGQTAVVRVSERFDQVILGTLSGTTGLGLYSVAYNLASIPVVHVLPLLGLPAASVLSRAQVQSDIPRLARGYLLAVELMMSINASISFGLLAIAPTLVPLVLGEKWLGIVPILQCLCVVTIWYAFYSLSGALVIATGASRIGFLWRLALTSVLVAFGYLGAKMGGAVWLAGTIAVVLTLGLIPFYFLIARRLLGPCARGFATAVGAPTAMAAIMAIVVIGAESVLRPLPTVGVLVAQIGLGAGLFASLLVLLRPSIAREMILVVPYQRLTAGLLSLLASVEKMRHQVIVKSAHFF